MKDNNDQLALDIIKLWESEWVEECTISCQARANLQCDIIELLFEKDLQVIKAEARAEMFEQAHKYVSQILHGE